MDGNGTTQTRTCQHTNGSVRCNEKQTRTVGRYAHTITLTGTLNNLTLTVTLYSASAQAFTFADFLTALNAVDDKFLMGDSYVFASGQVQNWGAAVATINGITKNDANSFIYHYTNAQGNPCSAVATGTCLTITDRVKTL